VFLLVIAVLVLVGAPTVAVVAALIVTGRYRNWAPARWRKGLVGHVAGLHARDEALAREAAAFGPEAEAGIVADSFRRSLAELPLDRLTAIPGVGPGTVARLRQAGFRSMADIAGASFLSVPGIGPKTDAELRQGIAWLVSEARTRFDRGEGAQAAALPQRLTDYRRAVGERLSQIGGERSAIAEAIDRCRPLLEAAEAITLTTFFAERDLPPKLVALMSQPLPQPRAIVEMPGSICPPS